ncbi:2Fe-2S iron-sulfur cluster-binding protein [Burkholderia sp. USMB20]|uniref:2Fe-2S iron-sulfur cluster-binding protein n=1 Tax=Burkholderia sp. USMB20 TaxID=1571773 RepID=UPI0005CED1D0|nr:2Fe-2S iron-sulfur cluster-binding protein [Burkholderia sp. USMB20]TGN95707.1 2Fe-2S iron-sulfur cluster binding domain-containing protein [Burkholderia sp. USMB20]
MKISVLPLERDIEVTSGDNLLDALRAHEIPISYSCMAGRCGTCRCTVVSGSAVTLGADATGSRVSGGQSVLACQATLVEDCVIEIPEVGEIVVYPSKILKATVVGIEDLTHDIKRVRLALSKPFDFAPGQYATLQFTPEHIRPYSMANTANGQEVEFHIRLVPGGRVTSYVAADLKPGDSVRLSGPLGTAYLRRKSEAPVLCIAGGTGLAPILSILRGMAESPTNRLVHVYFGVRSEADVYGTHWLEELRECLPGLRVHVVLASAAGQVPYRTGMVTDAVDADWNALDGWRAYVAGAPALVDASYVLLRRKGVNPDRIHADAFYASEL